MPEQRGREHHMERLADAMRDEIAAILEGELADPRIGLVTVSDAKLAPGGKVLHVSVEAEEDETAAAEAMEGLASAKGYIRRELTFRLRLRQAPELVFHLDRSHQATGRVEELLRRAEKRKKKSQQEKGHKGPG